MSKDYDFQELSKYCRERNTESIDLPEDELKMFEIDPPLFFSVGYYAGNIRSLMSFYTHIRLLFGGPEGDRTFDLCVANAALCTRAMCQAFYMLITIENEHVYIHQYYQ